MKFTSTALLLGSALLASVNGISHPGINHNLSDLKRIKSNVASRAEPCTCNIELGIGTSCFKLAC